MFVAATRLFAQTPAAKWQLSVETDPAFWAGTLRNGVGFDANVDVIFPKYPNLRVGVLAYSGKWSGEFGQSLLLTKDFLETNWTTQWNGAGVEAQYQFRFGKMRGGLQAGGRAQWNQFRYVQAGIEKAVANHVVLTPQVGYQVFPFKKLGLYFLPWAGVQLPVAGTDAISINQTERATRKPLSVVTAHVGWM